MMKEFREIFGNKDVHHQVTYHHKVENILHIQKQEKNFICVFMMNSFCSFFFFLTTAISLWDLVPQSEIKPRPPAVEGWSPNHWPIREVPIYVFRD